MNPSPLLLPLLDGIPIKVFDEYRQRRKHHKKRINKKWLKRYGYTITTPLKADEIIYLKPNEYFPKGYLYMNRKTYDKFKASIKGVNK